MTRTGVGPILAVALNEASIAGKPTAASHSVLIQNSKYNCQLS